MSDNVLSDIQQHQQADHTFTGSGHPHTFVELYGGRLIYITDVEPDILSFRDDYYYNSIDNNLYIKKANWQSIDKQFDDEDDDYVYYGGRSVKKMVNEPDPKKFGDMYYYSLISNKIFGRVLRWVKCTNL